MYNEYFGFEELPFSVTPDPRFFYSNAVYQSVLDGLEQGIQPGDAFIVITGEAGTGKTTLLHRCICSSEDSIEYSLLVNPCSTFTSLLRTILKNLGLIAASTDRQILLDQLHGHVREEFAKGRTVAVLFDEAQGLSDEVLEELRLLHDIDHSGETLIPIVLVGQPDLDRRLDNAKLRQIKECITLRRRLVPLKDHDVYPYLTFRLEHAGYHGNELFEPAAVERLIAQSSGIPRLINNICDNALLLAYRASEHTVTAAMIDAVAHQLRLVDDSPRENSSMRLPIDGKASTALPGIGHDEIHEFAAQPRFDDQCPSESCDRAQIVEEASPAQPVESNRTDDPVIEDRDALNPSFTDEVDRSGFVAEFPSHDKTTSPDQLANSAKLSPVEPGADNTDDQAKKEDRDKRSPSVAQSNTAAWRKLQFRKGGKLEISIGTLLVLIILAWGWIEFYPRYREGSLPAADSHVANIRNDADSATLPLEPVEEPVNRTVLKETPQPLFNSPPPAPAVGQDTDQKDAGAQKKSESVEVAKVASNTQPPSPELYRVSGASYLRNRPSADAEIIDTLESGTRIVVTSKSGEYFRVRSLRDEKVSGFVHREDAFFERIR